ncbi:MAG: UDP-3-O-[3-hydroxymyristoyl] N-acetylglucosamine deacetylase [Alphaproteobacteria bacterium]|nr:UDP-3-O-[3-hydroxymyristoyl] N-acetylglucosamine deacetylase [Alphaproteobacteria bacterium]
MQLLKKQDEKTQFIDQKLPKFLVAEKQRTLLKSISVSGIGLHTGNKVSMTLSPAPPNTGYTFRLNKKGNLINIRALYSNVKSTELCTLISDDKGNSISTVEHILSALYGLEVDNVFIDVDSNEIPVCDGSSKVFVNLLKNNGFQTQNLFKNFIKIKKIIEVNDGDKIARVTPFDQTMITCDVEYSHKFIGKQSISLALTPELYETQISSARTFGFMKDVEELKEKGLIKGGSLDNAIVLDDNKVLNEGGLRFTDEFVRHKVLDFIGDISLAGNRIIGSFFTSHTGHELNIKLLKAIFSSKENWELVSSN